MKQAAVIDRPSIKSDANKTAAKIDSPIKAARGVKAPAKDKTSNDKPLTLSELIHSQLDGCSRAQRDVALYIIDHLEESAFQTAEQLAAQVQTSSSTVVRFSQALGFEGFPELQTAAREEYRAKRREQETGGTATLFGLDPTPAESTVMADQINIEETARRMNRGTFDAAVEAITQARQILVVGTDQMAFFASYMRHMLMLLDHRCELVASPSQDSINRIARIDENTLVITLCAGRPHTIVTRAMRLANTRGAQSISITDASMSEIAKLSTHHVYYSSTSPSFVRSHTALLAIVQGLVHGLYESNSAAYSGRIRAYRGK
ncbi:MAG: MurR/RpiR family transcriptional regulator [Actinobacteria bacterium]|nr:MurR/RpiR family transcriptional regulator [Actinomycetota bacterium]